MPHSITDALPTWVRSLLQGLQHPFLRLFVVSASVLMFAGSVIAVPWLIVRVPADYFSREQPAPSSVVSKVARNAAGAVLFVLGVAMLVLPGQGVLAILAALLLMDFPGKRHLERRIIGVPRIRRAVNALRQRAGRAPFEQDPHAG